jgi:very-short-patch-repair endonuclease
MSDLVETLCAEIRLAGLPEPEREVKAIPGRLFRFDLCWRDRMLAAEVDGGVWVMGRHNRPSGFEKDAEKMSLAAIAGWRVLRLTASMVKSGKALELVERALTEEAA